MKLISCVTVCLILLGCEQSKTEEAADPQPEANPKPAQVEKKDEKPVKPVHFKKRVAELVDKKKAMAENAKLVEMDRNRISSDSYLTAVAQGYFAAASRIELLNLQNAVRQLHALNDRYPTFEEFKDLLKQTGVRLGNLYEYQMYAYDDEAGDICILEDREYKKRIYEAAGRDYPHAE